MSVLNNPRRVFIAGHKGMVGSAIVRLLGRDDDCELILRTSDRLDLRDQAAVRNFFARERIDEIYLAAARVGGIHANDSYPADFIYQNLMIQNNIIEGAYRSGVDRLLFLGSSCIYPKMADQPMEEVSLLSGSLEKTNEPYAIAKIAGIKLCESFNRQHGTDYRSVMPTNLYGVGDTYHQLNSHVIPALIKRFYLARVQNSGSVHVWGDGRVRREFLYVDDLAEACLTVMRQEKNTFWSDRDAQCSHINIGAGRDCEIRELSAMIANIVGFDGEIYFDDSKPSGPPRKLLDVSQINRLGWTPKVPIDLGLNRAFNDFVSRCTSGDIDLSV